MVCYIFCVIIFRLRLEPSYNLNLPNSCRLQCLALCSLFANYMYHHLSCWSRKGMLCILLNYLYVLPSHNLSNSLMPNFLKSVKEFSIRSKMSLKMEEKDCKIDCDQSTVVVDHLCCKICYEPYQENGEKEPKVMKCGHSICLNCVGMIYKKHSHIKCPFCKRVDHVRPNTLPKNFDMVCMIPHYPKLPPNHVCTIYFLYYYYGDIV